jgi:putative DNA primase/helicase
MILSDKFFADRGVQLSDGRAFVPFVTADKVHFDLTGRHLPGVDQLGNESVTLKILPTRDNAEGLRFRIETKEHFDGWVPNGKHSSLEIRLPLPPVKADVHSLNNPLRLVQEVVNRRLVQRSTGMPMLRYWNECWYRYCKYYGPTTDAEITRIVTKEVYALFTEYNVKNAGTKAAELKPTSALINDVLAGMRAFLETQKRPGQWFNHCDADTSPFVVVQNGILNLATGFLIPHTINLFAISMLPWSHEDEPAEPTRFLQLLDEYFGKDEDSKNLLQEICGSVLVRPPLHFFVQLSGPPRSGKGIITRLLTDLVGWQNCAATTLHRMGDKFGLESAVDKPIIFAPEVCWEKMGPEALETLKQITARDAVEVTRKNKPSITSDNWGVLVASSNAIPQFRDNAGAIEARMILLRLRESFVGKEDPYLSDKLRTELPAIAAWAGDGWRRLKANGKFTQPEISQEIIDSVAEDSSPVREWVSDCCVVGPAGNGGKGELFDSFRRWCEVRSLDIPCHQTFCSQLLDAFPKLRPSKARIRDETKLLPIFKGIALKLSREHARTQHENHSTA